MILDDIALARIALGVAAASGVLLAVLIAVHISVITKKASDQKESLDQIRNTADRLYQLIQREMFHARLYFELIGIQGEELIKFMSLVTGLSRAHSNENVPDYFQWRVETDIFRKGVAGSRSKFPNQSEGLTRFDLEFIDNFWRLDSGIQFNELPKRLDGISRRVGWATRTAGMLLLLSLLVGIISATTSINGISDSWNLLLASSFLVIGLILVVVIESIMRTSGMSQQELIDDLVRTKMAGKINPLTSAKLLVRRITKKDS